jgi:hypothetical protein
MNTIIYKTINDVANLKNTTYLIALLVVAVAIGIAFLISNLIAFEGGLNPKDPSKRTWGYWLTGVISTFLFFGYNQFLVVSKVATGFKPDFQSANLLATGVLFVLYIIIGLIMKMMFRKAKFGTVKFWFK